MASGSLLTPLQQLAAFHLIVKQKDAYLRAAQFAARFLAYALKNKQHAAKAASLMTALGGGRKCFGLLNTLTEGVNLKNVISAFEFAKYSYYSTDNDQPMNWVKGMDMLKFGAMMNFWVMDNMIWLSKFANVAKLDQAWLHLNSQRIWFLAVVAAIAADTSRLIDLAPVPGEKPAVAHKRQEVRIRMCRQVCDFFVAGSGANLFRVNEGIVSILGAVSALIMCYELWPIA